MTDRHFADISALRAALTEAAEAFAQIADPEDILHAVALLERYRHEQSWQDALDAHRRNPPTIGYTLADSPHQSLPLTDLWPAHASSQPEAPKLGFCGPKVVSIASRHDG